jgi:hypothetical protein
MAELRDEIIASEKIRADLLKWKLIIVSTLGAAGLGFGSFGTQSGNALPYAHLVLGCIPLACVYVDLLCKHSWERIMVIGQYKRSYASDSEHAYETIVQQARDSGIFSLEDWALSWSSYFLSVAVGLAGILMHARPGAWLLLVSGVIGMALTYKSDSRCCQDLEVIPRLVLPGRSPEKVAGSTLPPSPVAGEE